MPTKIVNTKEISRDIWLGCRRRGIGGSDASAVMGLNPYCSAIELYADKLGLMPEKEDNEAMRTGRDLEDYVAQRFCEATGKKVRRNNFMWRHGEHEFLIADIDREVVGENAGLECKTTSVWNKSDFAKGEIPLNYYVQCVHYMMVMGYERMYLAVLVLNKGFHYFVIERNENEISALMTAEASFWRDFVTKGIEPPPNGSESAQKAIDTLWGVKADGEEVLLFECAEAAEQYAALKAQIKELETAADTYKQTIQVALKEHGRGATDKYKISWLPQSRTSVDSKKLQLKYPEVYSEVAKTTESRIFRLKEIEK